MSVKSFAQFVGTLFNAWLETARHWAVRSWGMFLTRGGRCGFLRQPLPLTATSIMSILSMKR
jgi:hypothetical protein